MLDKMKCSSSFDTIVATVTGLQFEVSDIFPFLFLHIFEKLHNFNAMSILPPGMIIIMMAAEKCLVVLQPLR